MAESFAIEVCYARADKQFLLPLTVQPGTTLRQAIEQSGLLHQCPEIDLNKNKVGVYREFRSLDEAVSEGDRVEIYRELLADPKESRRRRSQAKKHG